MRRQFVIATVIVAIMVLVVLMVPPIMSEQSDKKDTSCIYCDITGDSRNDVLVRVTTFDGDMPMFTIIAVDGSNGKELWKSEGYLNCYADTQPVGDLDGDNKPDVLIVLGSCVDIFSGKGYGEVIGVKGCDGTELWSTRIEGARNEAVRMFANPANLTSASRTDVVVNTITYTLYGPETKVMAINGRDEGKVLWEKSVTTANSVFGVPVDIDNDGIDEVVIGMPEEMAKSLALEGFKPRTSNVTVVNGNNGKEFWKDSKDYSDVATFEPAGDLNGDGKNDLMVWIGCRNGGCKLEALRGTNGEKLWAYEIE